MTSRVLSPTDLHAYIPHRGPNLLLDQLVIRADGKEGIGEVLVLPGDARGRELFGRLGPGGVPCWSEPFLGEILALCGIVLVRDELTAMGKEGVFSMVSRIAIGRLLRLDRPVRARAELMRSRSGFWQFGGGIEQDGEVIFSGEFMGSQRQLGVGRWLIGAVNTGKVRQLTSSGLGIQPLWITGFCNTQGNIQVNLDKLSGCEHRTRHIPL